MIIGIGYDTVDVRRLARVLSRYPRRFPEYILTADELPLLARAARREIFLAGRWAAKEALGKALGCGMRFPLTWQQVGVFGDAEGKPWFTLSAAAAALAHERGVARCHLSISHDGNYAGAVVIAEGER